jgi:peptidoglycan/LPS O-acetylase OafA/YrhL
VDNSVVQPGHHGERGYMSQLDSLRFFAVLGVMVLHFWDPRPELWILRLNWGALGVRLFFVLSGFLITGILLGCREFAERQPGRHLFLVRQFYIRRFLRIFPLYYLVLLVLVVADIAPARNLWPWLFSYTTNIWVWHHLNWPEKVGHFWTLAVEEQFYLVWPWLVLFLRRRWLVPLLLALTVLSPAYRFYAAGQHPADAAGNFTAGALTIAVVDNLAFGALLALLFRSGIGEHRVQQLLQRVVLPIGTASFVLLLASSHYGWSRRAMVTFDQSAAGLIFCWLIGRASRGFGGWLGRLLEYRPLPYLGKISYGIYVFHNFVPPALVSVAGWLGYAYHQPGQLNFLLGSVGSIALAALSWELFERRINGLKRYFRYGSEPAQQVRTTAGQREEGRPPAGVGVTP